MSVPSSKRLGEASVQEIQLELIRRSSFNAFDGERVVASLLAYKHLWEAVFMDRLAISKPGKLPSSGLTKLRDLAANVWNVDTIYILTPDVDCARKLARIAKTEDWAGMVQVRDDPEDVDRALGGCEEGQAVVSIWWD
jgi:hypothetical protein